MNIKSECKQKIVFWSDLLFEENITFKSCSACKNVTFIICRAYFRRMHFKQYKRIKTTKTRKHALNCSYLTMVMYIVQRRSFFTLEAAGSFSNHTCLKFNNILLQSVTFSLNFSKDTVCYIKIKLIFRSTS